MLAGASFSCSVLPKQYEPEPQPVVTEGYRCPPLKEYTDDELDRALEQAHPGSTVDMILNDYFLIREQCR